MDTGRVDTGDGATWASGDYPRVGNLWLLIGELLCEAAAIRPGERVLDVATGTGNTALAAARRFATVTGVDYVPDLLEHATARAAAEGLHVDFETGDAERLRFADGAFDVAVSTFGVQYVPDQDRAAAELLRVVRPGGRIALASWSPDGFLGELLRLVGEHTGPAAPTLWGREDHLKKLLGPRVSALTCTEHRWLFRFPTPEAFISYFRAYFGPLTRAYATLPPSAREALTADLTRYITDHDQAPDGTVEVPSTYLQAIAVTT
ncbi:hypothetical protein GCM10010182_74660 [Actinomadura cremea]|nr:hypothetical protein GCM10010182_74660 [Actinomadura cremea]